MHTDNKKKVYRSGEKDTTPELAQSTASAEETAVMAETGSEPSNDTSVMGTADVKTRRFGKHAAAAPAAPGDPDGKKKSKKTIIVAAIVVAVALVAVLIGVGVSSAMNAENEEKIEFYGSHVFANTTYGGVDISDMTADEAAEAVNSALDGISVTVSDGEDSIELTAADADVSQIETSVFEEMISSQDAQDWKVGCEGNSIEMPAVEYDRSALKTKVSELDCVSGKDRTDPVDAQLSMKDGEFEIIEGKDGNRADADELTDAVLTRLTKGAYQPEEGTDGDVADGSNSNEGTESTTGHPDEDNDGYDDLTDEWIGFGEAVDQVEASAVEELAAAAGESSIVSVEGLDLSQAPDEDPIDVSQYYKHPTWTGDEEQFQAAEEKAKLWLSARIDYTIDMIEHAEVVDSSVIEGFIKIDQTNIDVVFDESAVKSWLSEIGKKYDTVGTTRTYTSPTGKTVELSGGHYGWTTDEASELTKLEDDIMNGRQVQRDFSYEQTADGPKGGQEWGNTYIDLDITAQTVTYVKNGSVVFTADCVTGTEIPSRQTDRGFYSILWKHSPHVMVGDDEDGDGEPDYRTPCTYFILFNYNGSAFHDADSIRSNWSKNAHYSNGSHGCANMHDSDVAELWNICNNGDPVIVHD